MLSQENARNVSNNLFNCLIVVEHLHVDTVTIFSACLIRKNIISTQTLYQY